VNGYERIMAAFQGERPDRVPVMLHNFMHAAREAGLTMSEFRSSPREIARAFIESVEKYGCDGVLLDIDTATLAGAIGVPIDFPHDEPARVRGGRLKSLEEVGDLGEVDIRHYPGVQVWLEAATLLRKHFADEIAIRGNCDQSPFTLASMVRGIDGWMEDLLNPDHEERIHQVLEYCTAATLGFVSSMAATGVHLVSNGDSVAGPELVSPALYRRFALPYERRIVKRAHELGLPYVLHICGNAGPILDDMLACGADGLELDHRTDATLAHSRMKSRAVFLGNLDPSGVLALGTPVAVEAKTRELLEIFADTPRFILNAGCAIPPVTPEENIRAMIKAARSFS
jgi:MtaA/CmuA family methyltransferase